MLKDQQSILIVEDNFLVQDSLKKLLSILNVSVISANNGLSALELVKEKRFDLIFCDYFMPKLDGFEFFKRMKKSKINSNVPVVILTSSADKEELNKMREEGVDDIILKPYDPSELLAIAKGKLNKVDDIKYSIEQDIEKNKKQILHTLSHELRTPLLAIQSSSDILLERRHKLDNVKIDTLLEAIYRGSQRLEKLISNFLTLQQIEIGIHKREIEENSKKANLKKIIEDIIENFKNNLLNDLNVNIELIDCSCGINVNIHEEYFRDTIERIFDNAIKFSKSVSKDEIKIEIYLLKELDNAVIEIADNGIGFNDENAKSAVKLFSQINRDVQEQQGSGVGLYICSEYIKAHEGTLEIQGREHQNKGAVVRITLPCI